MLIHGTITDIDGHGTEFVVDADRYMQWGGTTAQLGERVRILAAIEQVLAEYEEGDL